MRTVASDTVRAAEGPADARGQQGMNTAQRMNMLQEIHTHSETAPPKAAISQAQGGMRSPPCFPTSHSTGPSPGPEYELLKFRSQTRHTGSSSNRKLADKPTHQLPWPSGYSLCVYLRAPASRGPHDDLCFVSDIKGNELLERKPENETSSGNEKDQGQVKEQMTFLPEKYQEYSLNPTSFKSCPIQSRDPASPAQRGLNVYQDTAS